MHTKKQSIENTHTKQSCVSWALALEGPGAEIRDMLPNIRLHAFNLFQTDIGGDNDTFKMDAGLWFLTLSTNPAFYPPSGVGYQ